MMRIGSLCLGIFVVGAMALGGCDDDGDDQDMASVADLAVPGADLAGADLATPGDAATDGAASDGAATDGAATDGAAADGADMIVRNCLEIVGCAQQCGDDSACIDACVASGDQGSQDTFRALAACTYGICTQATDAGAPACSSNMDRSAGCRTCLSASAASCPTEFGACASDT